MLQQKNPEDFVIGTGKLHSVKDFLKIAFEQLNLNYKNYITIDRSESFGGICFPIFTQTLINTIHELLLYARPGRALYQLS